MRACRCLDKYLKLLRELLGGEIVDPPRRRPAEEEVEGVVLPDVAVQNRAAVFIELLSGEDEALPVGGGA